MKSFGKNEIFFLTVQNFVYVPNLFSLQIVSC